MDSLGGEARAWVFGTSHVDEDSSSTSFIGWLCPCETLRAAIAAHLQQGLARFRFFIACLLRREF